jgi:alpha-tubulin suppressor-like RCC1 family protein
LGPFFFGWSFEMLIFRSASRRGVAACLSVVAPALVASACTAAGPGPERIGANASAVWSLGEEAYEDNADTDDLRQNIVVSLAKTVDGPSVCTGTLLTPRVVLTAASCKNDGKAGALPFVRVGGRVPFKQTARATSFLTANTPALEPSLSGKDVGVVFLDSPILETAQIHHPPFVAPPPTSIAPGGLETFPHVGMAGWSTLDPGGNPIPSPNARQAIVSDLFSMWRYWQISSAQEPLWVYSPFANGIPKSGLAAGDDGGLLFVLENGHRDIIGVASIIGMPLENAVRPQALPALQSPSQFTQCDPIASGSATSCTAWVDVTNAAVHGWLVGAIADTTRGPNWLAAHPRVGADQGTELWIGDVDYTGPCTPDTDPDCDHTWTRNADNSLRDNCPDLANVDQIDTDDGGAGDACGCAPGEVGVHEGDFSNRKVCVALGPPRDVTSANALQSVSVPHDRDVIVCAQSNQSGACALEQRDWLSTGTLRSAGIQSAVTLDRGRTIAAPPAALVQPDTTYSDADYATIDMSAYSGNVLNTCFERCTADARCQVLTVDGTTCHLKATKDGGPASSPGVTAVLRGPLVQELALGGDYTCALMTDATVRCSGGNRSGQLGDGTLNDRWLPAAVTALTTPVSQIAAGTDHTCAVMSDGSARCWGANAKGQLGDGTTINRLVPVSVPSLGNDVQQIASHYNHTCALMKDGSVRCWGENTYGQLGDGTTANKSLPVTVTALGGAAAQIGAGLYHSCALMTDGTVRCWGGAFDGELGTGHSGVETHPLTVAGLGTATQISVGYDHTCAVMTDGSERCWGGDYYGEIGDGPSHIEARWDPFAAIGSGVKSIAAGYANTCAVMTDASLRCWGGGGVGTVGDGGSANRTSPVVISALGNSVRQVAIGGAHACAKLQNGSVRCWGVNTRGEFGNGSILSSSTPTKTNW